MQMYICIYIGKDAYSTSPLANPWGIFKKSFKNIESHHESNNKLRK